MDFDLVVIGGGVVGLACAREGALRGFSTLLVERHESFGRETSSRNSEVIHSGIYYPPGSVKAELCVAGNAGLYDYCARAGVWHRKCGKLIVAVTPEEEPEMHRLHARGLENGVAGLELLTGAQVASIEPAVRCRSAIRVPSTGIIDSHELMRAFMREARDNGCEVVFSMSYEGMEGISGGYRLRMADGRGESTPVSARFVVNAAGLQADRVAASFGIDVAGAGYLLHPNRGHYFRVSAARSKSICRLIYPMPHPQLVGTGIHITIDRAGQCKLGPDTEYVGQSLREEDWYKFDESRIGAFHSAVARYFPALRKEDLFPDQVGVRAKLQGPGENVRDFVIREESSRGLPGVVNLVGIESPGLTCSMEIAREACRRLSR